MLDTPESCIEARNPLTSSATLMMGVDNGDIPPVIQPSSLDASGNTYDALSMARKRARDREGKGGYKIAGATGLEPATSGVTGQCSNQLNYRPATVLGGIL